MSKITVTTIAGLTSGGDANTVKIESGDAFNVVSGATTLGGAATISGDLTVDTNVLKVDATNNRVGIGTASPSDSESLLDLGSGENTGFKRKLLITNVSNSYIEKSFDKALEIIKKNGCSGLINGPVSKKSFLKGKFNSIG